jgi:transposase
LWWQSFSHISRPAIFLPVEIVEEVGPTQAPGSPPPVIEILLRNGRCLKVPADVELKMLSSLVACVEAA